MKNPHPLSDTWTRSINEEPVLITVPGTIKKFKRKSREPQRLKPYPAEMSDVDTNDDIQTEICNATRCAPIQRHLMMSNDMMTSTTRILSGLPEGNLAPAQSSAIDMRIGINFPSIPSQLSHLPAVTFSKPEIYHWPTAISQPLSNRLKVGLCSTFPLSKSISSSHSHSPSHQAFSLEPALLGQTAPLPIPRAPQASQCQDHVEPHVQLPKVSVWSFWDLPMKYLISSKWDLRWLMTINQLVSWNKIKPLTYIY